MKAYPISELNALHKLSIYHRDLLKEAQQCACFYCLNYFDYTAIGEDNWIDDDNTALCPYCSIDSVLPNYSNSPIEEDLLKAMKEYFFS